MVSKILFLATISALHTIDFSLSQNSIYSILMPIQDRIPITDSFNKVVTITSNLQTCHISDSIYMTTHTKWDSITNKPTFANVATTGDYNSLSNLPNIPNQIHPINGSNIIITGVYPNLTFSTSGLSSVATSGSYIDLSNLPTIPQQYNPMAGSNINISGSYPNQILSVSGLSGVATSGDYNSLINKPTVPSQLTPMSGTNISITGSYPSLTFSTSGLSTVATSGNYTDLTNKPTIPSQLNPSSGANILITGTYPNLTFSTTGLSTVATSGSYLSLSNRPTISTVGSTGIYADLTSKPILSTVSSTGSYTDLINKPYIPSVGDTTNWNLAYKSIVKVYNKSGLVGSYPMKIWDDTVTVTSSNGQSIDISSAGFTKVTSVQAQAFNNTNTVANIPVSSGKTWSTTSIAISTVQENTGLSILAGLLFAGNLSGVIIHVFVIGY